MPIELKIEDFNIWQSNSENSKSVYVERWKRSLQDVKGIWPDNKNPISKTRNRSKIFHRKTYSLTQRILADLHDAFLLDPDSFKLSARGGQNTFACEILQIMTSYYTDLMFQTQDLYIKLMSAFTNIINLGWHCDKLHWRSSGGNDELALVSYPPEQVWPDLSVHVKSDMEYIIFENHMSPWQMRQAGFKESAIKKIEKLPQDVILDNQLKNVRESSPINRGRGTIPGSYPSPGQFEGDRRDMFFSKHKVMEVFYHDDGVVKFSTYSPTHDIYFNDEKIAESVYGKMFPICMGNALIEPHKLISEGFGEILSGPQESLNFFNNIRKDNITLAMKKRLLVNNGGGVDYQSLLNSVTGGIIQVDDINNTVKELPVSDVTSSSYVEASADIDMMDDMSGVPKSRQGLAPAAIKATVAALNNENSSAKGGMYINTVGRTYMQDFYRTASFIIQRFASDEAVFDIANTELRNKRPDQSIPEIFDIEGFIADCKVKVGLGVAGKSVEIDSIMRLMDRAIQSNQVTISLASLGIPGEIFNISFLAKKLAPLYGFDNVDDFMQAIPGAQQGGGQGGGAEAPTGATNQMNDLQRGAVAGGV